jgi:hypothetical protein
MHEKEVHTKHYLENHGGLCVDGRIQIIFIFINRV